METNRVYVTFYYDFIYDNEINNLDKCLKRLGVRIPELCELIDGNLSEEKVINRTAVCKQKIEYLQRKLVTLKELEEKQRGFAFEKFLVELFNAFGLDPRGSYKIVGEQFDGSFMLDNETYLVETKWQKTPVNNTALLSFIGKFSGKSKLTRGFYISYSGYSADGLTALKSSCPTSMICMDGNELCYILEKSLDFADVLRCKLRYASTHGEAFIDIRTIDINFKTNSFGVSSTRHI